MNTTISPIILDTDPGHDDALALMVLVAAGVNLKAITTVAGNASIDDVTHNAFFLRNLLKRNDIPIYSGAAKPFIYELKKAVVHGENGLTGIDTSQTGFTLTNNAVENICKLADEFAGELIIIAIGPLTNIAYALQKDPTIEKKIKELIIMGGAIKVCGNMNRVAEFNFYVDPHAADIIMKSTIKKTLIPLDVCNKTALLFSDFNKLKGTSFYEPIISMMKHFISGIEQEEGLKGAIVYDALAAYYLLNPAAYTIEPMDIVIETEGIHTRGMCVIEERLSKKKEISCNVAMDIDTNLFKKDFLRLLSQG